jgi:class 3 adenylate cyclase/predicted ATPase
MVCPKCGLDNPRSFAFCGRCGCPTTATSPGREGGFSRAERRQLSIMFCDLVGSTALSGQLDPEELNDLIRQYQSVCAQVIELHEGRIAQFLGDGLLIYFGYPLSHEDDAQRAVRAGLEIVKAVSSASEPPRVPLQVRIGIHTGLVIVGRLGGETNPDPMAISGETPNIAFRLQSVAEPGQLIISAATHRLIEGFFTCRSLGTPALKGVAVSMETFEVVEPTEIYTRFEKVVAAGLTPFVSRENEVGQLLERWQLARNGSGQVVMVTGEAGIGKSRLVQVLKMRTRDEPLWEFNCRCAAYYQNSALYPAAELLQRMLGFSRSDDVETRLAKLEEALTRFGFSLPETVPLLAALLALPAHDRYPALPMTPQRQKQKTFETVVEWLVRIAEQSPARLIVEDVHWVDPSTLELLQLVIERARTSRLLLILLFRPEFVPSWPLPLDVTNITLGRLSPASTRLMIQLIARGKELPSQVVTEIMAKTEGVPLFVEELTQMVLESGLVREHDGRFQLTNALPSLAIPSTLYDSLMARLDRLGTAKEVAQLAATIGKEFSYELLRAISPLEETRLSGALNRLVDAELLDQKLEQNRLRYSFRHALIRDAAYDSLLRSQRRQYHRKVAEALLERFSEAVEARPELVANHFTQAALIEKAIPYWLKAGQGALERSANQEAIRHLTKGLELLNALSETPQHSLQELMLRIALGTALMVAKGFASLEAQSVWVRARELCKHMADGPLVFQVYWALWVSHAARGEHHRAREAGEQCLRLAQTARESSLLLAAHHALGVSLLLLGKFAEGLDHLEQGAEIYDPPQHAALAYVYGQDSGVACVCHAAWALWFLGYPDRARRRIVEGLGLAHQTSHPISKAAAANIACWVYQLLRDHDAAREQAEAAVELSTEREFEFWRAMGMMGLGWATVQQGSLDEGIPQILTSLQAVRSTDGKVLMPYFLGLLAQAYAGAERKEEALRALAESEAALDASGETWWQAELYRLKGEVTLQAPCHDEQGAENFFGRALDISRHQAALSLELRASMSLSRLLQKRGQGADARRLLASILARFTEGFDTPDLQEAKGLMEKA